MSEQPRQNSETASPSESGHVYSRPPGRRAAPSIEAESNGESAPIAEEKQKALDQLSSLMQSARSPQQTEKSTTAPKAAKKPSFLQKAAAAIRKPRPKKPTTPREKNKTGLNLSSLPEQKLILASAGLMIGVALAVAGTYAWQSMDETAKSTEETPETTAAATTNIFDIPERDDSASVLNETAGKKEKKGPAPIFAHADTFTEVEHSTAPQEEPNASASERSDSEPTMAATDTPPNTATTPQSTDDSAASIESVASVRPDVERAGLGNTADENTLSSTPLTALPAGSAHSSVASQDAMPVVNLGSNRTELAESNQSTTESAPHPTTHNSATIFPSSAPTEGERAPYTYAKTAEEHAQSKRSLSSFTTTDPSRAPIHSARQPISIRPTPSFSGSSGKAETPLTSSPSRPVHALNSNTEKHSSIPATHTNPAGTSARTMDSGAPLNSLPVVPKAQPSGGRYITLAGSFSSPKNATTVQRHLASLGLHAYLNSVPVKGRTYVRVQMGPFPDKAQADHYATLVRERGGYPAQSMRISGHANAAEAVGIQTSSQQPATQHVQKTAPSHSADQRPHAQQATSTPYGHGGTHHKLNSRSTPTPGRAPYSQTRQQPPSASGMGSTAPPISVDTHLQQRTPGTRQTAPSTSMTTGRYPTVVPGTRASLYNKQSPLSTNRHAALNQSVSRSGSQAAGSPARAPIRVSGTGTVPQAVNQRAMTHQHAQKALEPKGVRTAPSTVGQTRTRQAAAGNSLKISSIQGATTAPPAGFPAPAAGPFAVMTGAFGNPSNAHKVQKRLSETGFPSHLQEVSVHGRPIFRVLVGPFRDQTVAQQAASLVEGSTGMTSRPIRIR
ncbi:MAG: SPOR domain-containing protein [Magnetococcales bacterium]|nr:SPOR domain-containing protein [Magnetococcales bacterium]